MACGNTTCGSVTPILDSAVWAKRTGGRKLVSTLLGIAAGIPLGFTLTRMGKAYPGNPTANFDAQFYLAALALVVIVHEAGHLGAGYIVGFRFSHISIGPFSLANQHGRLKVNIRRSPSGAAGLVGMHVAGVRRLRKRLLIFISGGPTANFVSFALGPVFLNPEMAGLPSLHESLGGLPW
jgi:hypothetical protein